MSHDNTAPRTIFLDQFSEEVWSTTYKDYNDNTIDDTMKRVAKAIASVEESEEKKIEWEDKFYDMLSGFKIVPGGRILSNAGAEWKGTTLINCFVSPRRQTNIDSMDGILEDLYNQTMTLKSEGGWGQNFSYIRPRGAMIHDIGAETPGAVKFMELFDKASDVITSGSGRKSVNKKAKGKIRKGAMMAVVDCWHPDVIEFVTAKQQPGRLTKFNVSVNCSDEFMNKLIQVLELKKKNAPQEQIDNMNKWDLQFPDTRFKHYKNEWDGDLIEWKRKGFPVIVYNTVEVTWLWELIMKSTYNRSEPGILFLDRANYFNPLNYNEKIMATNPCGEQVLAAGGICCLSSINLTQFINKTNTDLNYNKIAKYISYTTRFLDNINSYSNTPLLEYELNMKNKRRIGIGLLGWGSTLLILKTRYGSQKATEIRNKLMKIISHTAYETSIDLAEEKGMFTLCNPEKHIQSPFIQNLNLSQEYLNKMLKVGIRNSSLLSIQPTGNTSILANVVSGGCEPLFMHEYIRTVIVNSMPDHIADVTPKWFEGEWYETAMFKKCKEGDEEILRGVDKDGVVYKIDKNRGLTKEVLCEDYGVHQLKQLGEWDPKADWAATTTHLKVGEHLQELKGFAQYVDSAISKTINLPNDYLFEDFKTLYLDAYQTGYIKGLTTYRAGTMTTVLAGKNETTSEEEIIKEDVKLPDSAPSTMKTLKAEGKKWYLSVVYHESNHRPFALFVQTNAYEKNVVAEEAVEELIKLARKKGIPKRHIDSVIEKIKLDNNVNKTARLLSFLLRHGVLIKNIVFALDKVESAYAGSFVFAIKKYLSTYVKDGEVVEDAKCTNCGSTTIVFQEGCSKCLSCSSSRCG
jgi:ribonucleoside-diphosphate reductase alpha chain